MESELSKTVRRSIRRLANPQEMDSTQRRLNALPLCTNPKCLICMMAQRNRRTS